MFITECVRGLKEVFIIMFIAICVAKIIVKFIKFIEELIA